MSIREYDYILPVSFLQKALPCINSVARVVTKDGLACGFFLDKSRFITCDYVIPDHKTAVDSRLQFGYYENADGEFNPIYELRLDPDKYFVTSKEMGITVTSIKNIESTDFSKIYVPKICSNILLQDEPVNVISNAGGAPLSVTLRDGKITKCNELDFQFSFPGFPKASGSPVFNDEWEVIGMCYSSYFTPTGSLSEAKRIQTILQWLEKNEFPIQAPIPSINATTDVSNQQKNTTPAFIPFFNKIPLVAEDVLTKKAVFISYAHKDQEKSKWQNKLDLHLKIVQSIGEKKVWQDGRILAGDDWKKEIEKALENTKVAVLLIGPNYLNSDFILNNELPQLLESADKRGVIIMPLITHRVAYERSILAKFKSFNSTDEPLSELVRKGSSEKKLVDFVEAIAKIYDAQV